MIQYYKQKKLKYISISSVSINVLNMRFCKYLFNLIYSYFIGTCIILLFHKDPSEDRNDKALMC